MKTGITRIAAVCCAVAASLTCVSPARADTMAYIGYQAGSFGEIDLTTGAVTNIGSNLGFSPAGFGVVGTTLYSTNYGGGDLYTIDTTTGAATLVGHTSSLGYHDFGSTPGGLFGTDTGSLPDIYSTNPATGSATDLGSSGVANTGVVGNYRALSTGTESNSLYLTTDANLYTLDTTTGAATEVGYFGTNIVMTALLIEGGTLYGADESGNFYTIDTTTGAATLDAAIGNVGGAVWALAPISAVAPTPPGPSVPEPGTLALIGLGIAGLGFSRRRKAR